MITKSPLNEITGFNMLIELYEKNKNQIYTEWLDYKKTFPRPGKQGIVGILKTKDTNTELVYKISQYINYLVQHEYTVMNGLNDLSIYCPHFCKSIGVTVCNIDSRYKNGIENPFIINTKYPIEKEILLMENIAHSCKFYNYIRSSKVKEDILYPIIKQVLMGISIAQMKKKFTHYDLHSLNVMIKKCDPDVVFLYILDSETQIVVPTRGQYPVIIDFGFSYINDMEDGPLWPSMGHTDVGFMSDRFDWVADPKLFLVTVSAEIKHIRKSNTSKKFRNLVKKIFSPLSIDWYSGWDTHKKKAAMDYVSNYLYAYKNTKSKVFDKYEPYCLDLIQSLIILPLEYQSYDDIFISYEAFVKEFIKIEEFIGNIYSNLYILKGIVDFAREVQHDYLNDEKRNDAIGYFRRCLHERINKVTSFCSPKNIHYEIMLCSLLEFSRKMEGFLYNIIKNTMNTKNKEYNKLKYKSVQQIYKVIEDTIPEEYVYNDNTKLFVFDTVKQKTLVIKIPQQKIQHINSITNTEKGRFLYNIINT